MEETVTMILTALLAVQSTGSMMVSAITCVLTKLAPSMELIATSARSQAAQKAGKEISSAIPNAITDNANGMVVTAWLKTAMLVAHLAISMTDGVTMPAMSQNVNMTEWTAISTPVLTVLPLG